MRHDENTQDIEVNDDSKTKGRFLITFCKHFCWFQKQKIIAGIFIPGPKGVEVFNHKC